MFQLTILNLFAIYLMSKPLHMVQFIKDLFDTTLVILWIFEVNDGTIVKI